MPTESVSTQPVSFRARITRWLEGTNSATFSAYCIVAAFTTYFSMYAYRKPFTAGEFTDVTLGALSYKTVLVAAQVAGYTLSKFIGIKVVSEMPAARRAVAIIGMIAFAEASLLLFGLVPPPYNWPLLFLNGLPLGMVFGLVLAFLEGRQVTEALTAGLCASFILASGVVKSVGRILIEQFGVSEYWMPFATGLLFIAPLLAGVFMLSCIPRPSASDVNERNERLPMTRADRQAFLRRHAFGLMGLVLIYILLTVIRSIRDDFAVEILEGLDYHGDASVYAWIELLVVFGVLVINGGAIFVRNNRLAFLGAFGLIAGGFLLVLTSLWGLSAGLLSPFAFMVVIGLGTYVPYVAYHTTVFERMLSLFRERGNIGYVFYIADATGYLATVGILVMKDYLTKSLGYVRLLTESSFWLSCVSLAVTVALFVYYFQAARQPKEQSAASPIATESV